MTFVVETVARLEAAEERLTALLGALQRDPLQRVNVLTGSNLQRIAFRRRLAEALGATANVRFFTPIDLAVAIRRFSASPSRQPLPDGAEAILLDGILADLHREGRLRRLDPGVHGVDEAVAGSLTDLREGAVGAREYARALRREDDPKLHDLAAIYGEFDTAMATLSDRSSLYEDALDPRVPDAAVREALGDAPLVVIGLYDAPAVQVRLLARCADVADVRVVLVAPPDPEFDFARGFGRALARAGATVTEATVEANAFTENPAYSYFSAPSRQAEAEEIVRRILALAREHSLPFNQVAILHRLDRSEDDLLCAALRRAGVPAFRAAGLPVRHSAAGQAAWVLLELLLRPPQRHRLLEFFANPALAETIPPDVRAKPVLWERHSKQAGMVQGWDRFRVQLDGYVNRLRDEDRSAVAIETATELHDVVARLQEAAARVGGLTSWREYCDWFLGILDAYLAPGSADRDPLAVVRDRVAALAQLDHAGMQVNRDRFQRAATGAIRRAVLNDPRPLADGVFVGNVSAARSLRFTAVFLADCGERIFPPLIRQDPLLLDGERERLNARLRRTALPPKRERLQEERMLFRLVEQSAGRFLTISWARRSNTTGAPKLPSPLLLRSIPHEIDELARVQELEAQGVITKLPARLSGAAPSPTAVAAGDWSSSATALDGSDFRLAVLEAAGGVQAGRLLPRLWDGSQRYERARKARNDDRFSAWDGVLPPDTMVVDPLSQSLSATALETYATCPYRYYLRHVLRVGAVPEPGEALEMTPLDRGAMVHRILERWVQEALDRKQEWKAFLADEARLTQIAEEEFEREGQGGLAGLPTTWAIVQAEVLADMRELLRDERERAAQGYRPLATELEFQGLPLALPDGTRLTFNGRIDRVDHRVDQGRDGFVAIDYKTGRARKEATQYRSGTALQLPIYLQAVARHYDADPASVEAEYWYATRRGEFARSALRGADVLGDEQFWDALRIITEGIRGGRFFPYPGEGRGARRRPNCTFCDYVSVCSTDVDARFDHKKRLDQAVVRDFLSMQARQ